MGKRRIPKVEPDPIRTLHGSLPEETLDLHGMSAQEAERRVEFFLDRWARSEPGAVLRIITGKGARSPGTPVLRGRVRELLDEELTGVVQEWAVDAGGGGFLVRVRRRG